MVRNFVLYRFCVVFLPPERTIVFVRIVVHHYFHYLFVVVFVVFRFDRTFT